jgi:hypothetical protein
MSNRSACTGIFIEIRAPNSGKNIASLVESKLMRRTLKLGTALISATAAITPVAIQARLEPAEPSRAVDQPISDQVENKTQSTQILDDDGNPLPADIQDDLRQQLKEKLAPVAKPAEEPRSGEAPTRASAGEILVTGQKPRGAVMGDLTPERTFSVLDIDAYGASSVGELLQTLGPQVSTSGSQENNRPVTLLNGRRVSNFSEIAEIPTEAIERLEVFPEELALQYGYRPDQKVVNIVTFERFRSILGRLGYITSTEGGYDSSSIQTNYFAIRGNTRFDFGAEYNQSASLLESDRGLIQLGGMPNISNFRSLVPESDRWILNGLISRNFFDDVSSILNARLEANKSQSLLGQDRTGPLKQSNDTQNAHLGTTVHGRIDKWLWSFTGNYDRNRNEVLTEVPNLVGGRDHAQSVNANANAGLLLSGPVFRIPAGQITASARGSVDFQDFSSTSLRGGLLQRDTLSRDSAAFQFNLSIPLTSQATQLGTVIGKLSLNTNFQFEQFSDLGMLLTYGFGANWSPINAINVTASMTNEQQAPSLAQLGAPVIVTPNVRTYDLSRREVVDISQIFGGNTSLGYDDRRILKVGINAKPFATTDFTVSLDYVSTRIENPIAPFPIITPDVEAAFPDRFVRSADGRLLQIDARPINFESSRSSHLRWGINFIRPLGPVEPWMRSAPVRSYSSEAEARASVSPDTMVAMVQPGSAIARRFENLSSRFYLSLYHTWRLKDDIEIAEGLPSLDLLNGGAIDLRGGTRRHELELQAGAFKKGLGARVKLNWQSKTKLLDSVGASDLAFSDLTTVDMDLFMNIADVLGAANTPRWLKSARANFNVTNLLNTRQRVRDPSGSIPLSYQPAYLDPLGRRISIGFRMTF